MNDPSIIPLIFECVVVIVGVAPRPAGAAAEATPPRSHHRGHAEARRNRACGCGVIMVPTRGEVGVTHGASCRHGARPIGRNAPAIPAGNRPDPALSGRAGREETIMRGLILAAAVAAGIGLAGVAPASAAPLNGTGLLSAAEIHDAVAQAQWHGARRSHWRWGSRGYWHGPNRSHWRWGSRPRCHWRGRSVWGRC